MKPQHTFAINGNISKEMRVMGHGSQHGKHGTKSVSITKLLVNLPVNQSRGFE